MGAQDDDLAIVLQPLQRLQHEQNGFSGPRRAEQKHSGFVLMQDVQLSGMKDELMREAFPCF